MDVEAWTSKIRMFLENIPDPGKVSFDGGDIYAMADSIPVVRQIDRQLLNCGICLERYKAPKVLPCLHTFCEKCLANYIPAESLSVTCPICRQQSILPVQGVSALQTNFFITNLMEVVDQPNICRTCSREQARPSTKCMDCAEFLCNSCTSIHQALDQTKEHNVVALSDISRTSETEVDTTLVCPNHDGNALRFYCIACETAVCEDCTAVEHIGHKTVPLFDAIQEQKILLHTLVSGAREQVPCLEESINLVNDVVGSLDLEKKSAEEKILSAFEELGNLLQVRKTALLAELQTIYNRKHQILCEQKETLENIHSKITNCCDFTEETLKHGSETEILLIKTEMSEKLKELGSLKLQYQPEENECLVFDHTHFQTLRKSLSSVGAVQTNSAVAFETTASGEGLKMCHSGKATTVTVISKDRKGELVKVGYASLSAEIRDEDDMVINPFVMDKQNGSYEVTYTVEKVGTYSLAIKLYGHHIKGSPFKVKAILAGEEMDHFNSSKIPRTLNVKQKGTKRPPSSRSHGSNRRSNAIEDDLIMRIGEKGRNKGEFTNPQGLHVVSDKIIVADSNNQTVQVFNSNGDCKLKFGSPGRVAGRMQRPTGVASTLNGNYLVADYDNKWINVFSPEGKYMNKIGTGKLLGPKGVAVDRNGHIVVVDNKGSTIFIFQPNGKLISKFGSRGNRDWQFAGPHYVAINANNDIIVSDFHNHCIKVFDSEGNFLFTFGSNGEGNGQFNAPTGVAVDQKGNILVADWGNSRIQVFDSNGSFLSFVNTAADPLYGPQGLAVTSEGYVAVADSGNHCFKIYKYLQ
ncbi:tripartite motif-containing protein 2-like isoform X1 [Saccostrea echinata]|uniref:tripartite motif-containing protein 2-like isoform X1 n=2 Tax=Saccostrea echinata TaxID=191078 RepID=UPI002A82D6CF|nr:tripartite motif-containing protein 2-like isoform X1 [Saccostrea echinata]